MAQRPMHLVAPDAAWPALESGRAAYARREWDDAFRALSQADAASPLAGADLERLAWSAGLTARDDDMLAAMERAHQAQLDAGERLAAARAALWLGFRLFARGEAGRAGGWLGRAQRLVDDERAAGRDAVEQGYLLLPATQRHLNLGEYQAAHDRAAAAVAVGERLGDRDLVAFARNLQGRALLRLRRVDEGLALMDDVLISVSTGEVAPVMTGLIYCSAIAACQRIHAYDRMREWTAALAAWCAQRAQMVMFQGHCLIHRAQLLQLAGAWDEALAEARDAVHRCRGDFDGEAVGLAHYEQGEVHRLRGDAAGAEAAYREASRAGAEPQPGLALLRLALGDRDGALGMVRRLLASTPDALARARLLPAAVTVLIECGDMDGARGACSELAAAAADFPTPALGAQSAQARASLALAEGRAADAPEPLRLALVVWQRLGARHAVAETRVQMGQAFVALGDSEGARLEWQAAREALAALGAAPALRRVDSLLQHVCATPAPAAHGLSPRELQVLGLVAAGLTNKRIARQLALSDKTVDRHVSNIFGKLGVGSRAAATAQAYRLGLVPAAMGGTPHRAGASAMGDSAEARPRGSA